MQWGRPQLSPEEIEIRQDYRIVFGSPKGRKVLKHLLTILGFFDELVESPENLTTQNVARQILKMCSALTEENLSRLVDTLLSGE